MTSLRRVAHALRAPVSSSDLSVATARGAKIVLRQRCVRLAGIKEGYGVSIVDIGPLVALAFYEPALQAAAHSTLCKDRRWDSYYFYSFPGCRLLRYVAGGEPTPRFRLSGKPHVYRTGEGAVRLILWWLDVSPVQDIRSLNSKYSPSRE